MIAGTRAPVAWAHRASAWWIARGTSALMPRGVEIRPEQYYKASVERFAMVKHLRSTGRGDSPVAAYLCGLSVECALRALIMPGTEFYDRHDFVILAGSGALDRADGVARRRLGAQLNELTALWRNSLRFYSDELFAAFCRKRVRSLGLSVRRGSSPVSLMCARLFDVSDLAFTERARLWLE